MTIRHLLSHTSGYRPVYGTLALAGQYGRNTRDEALEVVRRQPALQFAPGSKQLYNSTGYVLLAEIVERITGSSFSMWMQENVFEPLSMQHTFIETEAGRVISEAAYSYSDGPDGTYLLEAPTDASYGAGDIFTTVGDLAKWMRNYQTAELGSRDLIREMMTPYVLANGDTTNYALGLRTDEHRGLRRVKHAGATEGYWTQFNYYPGLGTGVVVMSNYDEVIPKAKADRVAELFFGDQIAAREARSMPGTGSGTTVALSLLRQYTGRYLLESGETIDIELEGDTLVSRSGGRFPLIPQSETTFSVEGTRQQVRFLPTPEGGVQRAVVRAPNQTFTLRRVEPWSPSVGQLEALAGRYYSPELETSYELVVEGDQLVAKHRWVGALHLQPLRTGVMQAEENDMTLRFERNEVGRVTGYYAARWKARNVWFEKQR